MALTARVQLRQDPSVGPGFVLFLPLVDPHDETAPVTRWVFAPIRERNMMNELEQAAGANVRMQVFDDAGSGVVFGPGRAGPGPVQRAYVQVADRVFRLEARPGPAFFSLSERTEPWAILVLGLAATFLSFALVHTLRGTEQKSRSLALHMTSELRSANEALGSANEALEQLATTDPLTGIANRRVFDEQLEEEVARAQRNRTPLSVVILDLDHFKLYNDHYGHPQGDLCLKQVGGRLRAVTRRAGEVAARYGGEEFGLILPGSDLANAAQLAHDARTGIAALELIHPENEVGVVTASVGVASYDPRTRSGAAQLLAAADAALYRAKNSGRNRVELAP
jgi:diguanylate cyclase (GGDEF)-like protein